MELPYADDCVANGVTYREQDAFSWSPIARRCRYTWDHGTVSTALNIRTCSWMKGTVWRFTPKLGHAGASASIGSLSVSGNGVTITFTYTSSS